MVANRQWWLPWAGIVVTAAGCSYEPAPMPPRDAVAPSAAAPNASGLKASAQTGAASPASPSSSPNAAAAGPTSGPASMPASATKAAPSGPALGALPVQLSAGVALAQTLPDGTQMGFSVDYQYRGAAMSPVAAVWVIQRRSGAPARLRVQLQAGGNLATFVPWPPDEGPYQCRIEDTGGRALSATESLR